MTASYLGAMRLFSRDIRLFLVSSALVGLAWDGVRTVLFNLYLLRLGYGPEFVGLVNGAGAMAFALFCPPAGVFGSRWGSRHMLIAGMGLLVGGFGLLPLVEFLPASWRAGWLLATTVLTNLGLALYLVNGLPFMMGTTGTEERYHVFSFHIALIPLAAFVGSLVGGALPSVVAALLGRSLEGAAAYRFPLWMAAVLLIPAVLVLFRTQPFHPQRTQPTETEAPSDPHTGAPYGLLVVIALVTALRFGGRGTVTTFSNIYLDEALGISTALIGVLSATGQLLSIPAALGAPLLVARRGNPLVIFWGTLGMAVGTLPLALIPHWTAAGLGLISSTAIFSMSIGPLRVFSQELVLPRWRTPMASAFMTGAGLAFSAVSIAGGYAIAAWGYRPLFLIGAGLAAAGALLFWAYFRVPRGELARAPTP